MKTGNLQEQGAELYRGILKDPRSDKLRLEYADWLEHSGDEPRAGFIRLQVETAALSQLLNDFEGSDNEIAALEKKFESLNEQALLLLEQNPQWKELPLVDGIQWECDIHGMWRGLCAHITVRSADGFSERMGRVFDIAPVTAVHFEDLADADVISIASSPQLLRLTHLSFMFAFVSDDGTKALATSPYMVNIEYLNLVGNRITAAGGAALADSPYLDKLQYLNVLGNPIANNQIELLEKKFGKAFHY